MKCNKYWPETEETYGIYHVKMEKEETSANYTVRTFHLSFVSNNFLLHLKLFVHADNLL